MASPVTFQNDNIFNNLLQVCDDCNTYPCECTVNYCDVHYSVTTSIPVSVDEIIPTDIIRNSIYTPYGHVHESHISQVKQTSSGNTHVDSSNVSDTPNQIFSSKCLHICSINICHILPKLDDRINAFIIGNQYTYIEQL